MPVLNPDTSQAEDYSTPIEPGTYRARITTADAGKSKRGNQKLVAKVEITIPGSNNPRTRTIHQVVEGEGAFGFDQLLRACNLEELAAAFKDPSVSPKPAFDTDVLVGQELQVVIEHQLYKNDATGQEETRDQISGYLKL